MQLNQVFRENFKIAINSIRTNTLRTILTVLIIAVGIMALVGILTAIDSIKGSISTKFASMGSNTFVIKRNWNFSSGKRERRKNDLNISYREAKQFIEDYNFPALISINTWATWQGTVKYESKKTNPNISVLGTDENYIYTGGYEIERGRNFSKQEITMNRNVVIIGKELVSNLFDKSEDPIDKIISVGNGKYKIIGVLKSKGTSFGGSGDKICFIPITNVRQYFSKPKANHEIFVQPHNPKLLDISVSEAEGLFRVVRNLRPEDKSDFKIEKSDNLANMLIENLKFLTISATIIGIITLLGAAIGLMNIMLVSVSERTREIGIRKALGANSKTIKEQFLFEAVLIGQLGGILGIVLGILVGNITSLIFGTGFIIPWIWITSGIVVCFIVGISSGYFPAVKASRLDPIIALRHE